MEETLEKESCGCTEKNVGEHERLISGMVGTALVVAGLQRRSISGLVLAGLGVSGIYRSLSGHCALYSALGVSTATPEKQRELETKLEETVSIQRPRAEIFKFWRKLENLPRIMSNLESVEVTGEKTSHWTAKVPLGHSISWDAEIINEAPDELIAWNSLPDSQLQNAGSVRFEEGADGTTHVRVTLAYTIPGGKIGEAIASFVGEDPRAVLHEDLQNFKRFMESQPQGPEKHAHFNNHPKQTNSFEQKQPAPAH